MKWLRPGPPPFQTDLAMIGAKSGQHVLVLGAGEGGLAAALAGVTGLNGRTLAIDPDAGASAAIERAGAGAGVLIEFEQKPLTQTAFAGESFDIVVVLNGFSRAAGEATAVAAEAARLVRTGGRVIAIEGASTAGWLASLRRPAQPSLPGDAIRDLLAGAGLRATRVLAETEGVTYAEGSKR